MTQLHRLTVATRVFGLAAVAGVGLLTAEIQSLLAFLTISTVSLVATYLTATASMPATHLVAMEAAIAGFVVGLSLPLGLMFLPYLAALFLVAGLVSGLRAVGIVLFCQLVVLTLSFSLGQATMTPWELVKAMASWYLTGVGLGILGTWMRGMITSSRPEATRTYESAYRLVSQLRTVARRLSSGLDPTVIAREIGDHTAEILAAHDVAVFVRTPGGAFSPAAYTSELARELPTPDEDLAVRFLLDGRAFEQVEGTTPPGILAFPLRVGVRTVGAVVGRCETPPPRATLRNAVERLEEHSLRLDTALVFDEIRSMATQDERRRLAREIHDGIAQEVASLGYLVDAVTAGSESDSQQELLVELRDEITRIVTELRLSIFDLRSEVSRGGGLGAALTDFARRVGSQSGLTVHLSLDEGPTRLRPEVEAELLRIAQEAINNARKHADADNLWVSCRVAPPAATLEIRDDGLGMGRARSDSYGLRIMHERAERLGAELEIGSTPDPLEGGTIVRVALGSVTDRAVLSPENIP